MTDLPIGITAVPTRLGARARMLDGQLVVDLEPNAAVMHGAMVRASVTAYLVDVVTGITIDRTDDVWTFTTDMTVRMLALPAPERITATHEVLRRGRRSITCAVELTDQHGAVIGSAAIGFAHVPRKPDDPPKIHVTPEQAVEYFGMSGLLTRPLREEAGVVVIDASAGIVEMGVRPEVCNPAGTLQGAMVALLAEAAAEDLVAHRIGAPAVVVDLDIRYLGQARVGPVRTSCTVLGDWVRVELTDTATDQLATLVYCRTLPTSV